MRRAVRCRHRRRRHGRRQPRARARRHRARSPARSKASRRARRAAELRRPHHRARQCQPAHLRGPRRVACHRAEAAAIRTIHVSDAGRFGFARLNAAEQGIDAFGYVVTEPRHRRGAVGEARAAPKASRCACRRASEVGADHRGRRASSSSSTMTRGEQGSTSRARLVVAADGAHSSCACRCGHRARPSRTTTRSP